MIENLLKIYEIEKFNPLIEYINVLDKGKIKVLEDTNYNKNSRNIYLEIDNIKFEIVILTDENKTWISFDKYNSLNEKIEKVDFMMYTAKYLEKQLLINGSLEYSRIIRYSAFKYENNNSKVINSCYTYLGNNLVSI